MNNQPPRTAEEELTGTRETFRDFMFHAIHDLREPLRVIGTSAQFLANSSVDRASESAIQCLSRIGEGVDRLELLLRDIAAYCDAEAHRLQLAEISLEDTLIEAKRQISHELAATCAVLTYDLLPKVTGDFLALTTVFRHLLENACKFRRADPPAIHVSAVRQDSDWVLSVRDNGLGFKPAYATIIFQPFKRVHGRQYAGSGLGLALTKRIVEQHGGSIWAESTPGEGSTFRFSLPASA
jgi:light-regulated signal transduction histidine kinase (bacteriophytochrome)